MGGGAMRAGMRFAIAGFRFYSPGDLESAFLESGFREWRLAESRAWERGGCGGEAEGEGAKQFELEHNAQFLNWKPCLPYSARHGSFIHGRAKKNLNFFLTERQPGIFYFRSTIF